ncbi:MAG: glycosyltransferase family 92 protein [Chloroflexi bacterium]|nr:glycosyltransferase family 92 protein [Chloroflexota bacterium]
MDYLSLCLICKDENETLPEWLDYHILMGVDRFYIYDNESQVSLRETLKNYIERGWVAVVDIPGKAMQLHAYDHCLQIFGSQTFWLGFIDTDEFLVPKTTLDLKELLKGYESYGGLAVSSLFFGSNGHQTRPQAGQIAAYTHRTHETFQGNVLIKSIVQPKRVLMPISPHDFAFRENNWCVNEDMLLVDGMKFPCHTEKIQLNHYYCRSQSEIDLKLVRGWADHISGTWPRERFDVVNRQSTFEDVTILKKLEQVIVQAGMDISGLVNTPEQAGLLDKMAALVMQRFPPAIGFFPFHEAECQPRITRAAELKAQTLAAVEREDYQEAIRLVMLRLQLTPEKISLLVDLSVNHLRLGNPQAAWGALSQVWTLAPNSYPVLMGMAYFFLQVKNYSMAEKTCCQLLEMAPHNLMILGYLTEAMLGLGRGAEALKVGLPLLEVDDALGELPKGMAAHLVKLMADSLLEKNDFSGALRLWEARLENQKEDLDLLLELTACLILAGDQTGAFQRLEQARVLSSQNEIVLAQIKRLDPVIRPPSPVSIHPLSISCSTKKRH